MFAIAADPPVGEPEKKLPALREGANLPGPFHPYNITGKFGPQKMGEKETDGRFHCPVTEQSEDPMVLIFTRDTEVSDKLKALLQKLDTATEKNRDARLSAAVIFIEKEPEAAGDDQKLTEDDRIKITEERRLELAEDLRKKFAGMFQETNGFTKQNLVVLAIANDTDLKKYELLRNEKTVIVLCHKLRIKAVYRDELEDAAIDAIMKDIADKLGAPRK